MPYLAPNDKVCGRPLETFLAEIERFHGWQPPGILIVGFKQVWALKGGWFEC